MDKLPQLSLPARILGLVIGIILTVIGIGFGFAQAISVQIIILSAIATLVLFYWAWRYLIGQFIDGEARHTDGLSPLRQAWTQYRWPLLGPAHSARFPAAVADGRGILQHLERDLADHSAGDTRSHQNRRQFQQNRSAFIGIMVLAGLFSVGSMNIEGFSSGNNIKSMLLFASFLGIASVGQTLVALLGGLDLSIPFIIGGANVGLLYLIGLGVPPWLAVIIVLTIGTLLGVINGLLSYRLQGQALIVTLGTGFAISVACRSSLRSDRPTRATCSGRFPPGSPTSPR